MIIFPEQCVLPKKSQPLCVAHYRARDWKAAIAALEKAEALEPDKIVAFDGFFLAMAHWQIGQKDEASTWYGKAVAWMEKNKSKDLALARFRAEAEALLGVRTADPDLIFPNGMSAFAG